MILWMGCLASPRIATLISGIGLCGSEHVTKTVYRHVIVPAIWGGATVMDTVFGGEDHDAPGASEHGDNAANA